MYTLRFPTASKQARLNVSLWTGQRVVGVVARVVRPTDILLVFNLTMTAVESHLQTQRSAVKMLHERILILLKYVTDVLAGEAKGDHSILRSLAGLIASLPASENKNFRQEFDTEYEDVQLTAYLSSLTKSTNILNDVSPFIYQCSSCSPRSSSLWTSILS